VITISLVPIPFRLTALTLERNSLYDYPVERLAGIIREIGFTCTSCAKCCTRDFNGHVFLLDRDVASVRSIDPEALEPAPDPEFCDQNGTFYVSGYALKAHDDEHGSCWFLREGRCRIYDQRFTICRIYPYMLHREPDEAGIVDWRQFAGIDLHGEYGKELPGEEALTIARETKEYENAFLTQEIKFLECIQEHFTRHKFRHVQKIYDDRMRTFAKGGMIRVMVYYNGGFEEHLIRNE
jgi:Fe-S-cluster containining protein